MRLNDLLGRRVVDGTGTAIGGVADVRLVQDGPVLASMQSALRVDGLIVVEHHTTRLFGYERHVGPALLRWLVHRRLGEVWYLPWDEVDHLTDGTVTTSTHRANLKRHAEMARY
ncbi:PRC-barrel domain containing protein [Kribbella pittospori]|uniref:PRC-barrel domain containing protein n=1 Tax=Kribbella pittospori TaxID=722689 RepID=A0A4R0KF62_9ACTN|nr:PRC-barrel domain containing protein [Kribbella pittospori]TCC57744.1 PRC-barrel domain containing protein [Kribbella pittospori]